MDPLDRLEASIDELEFKEKYASRNRMSLLIVHALVGVAVGATILRFGIPLSFSFLGLTDELRLALGLIPFLGGLILLGGLLFNRLVVAEGTGMTLLLVWDVWMVAGFMEAYKIMATPNPYPIFIYVGLSAFMTIHLFTFYVFMKGRLDGDY